VGDEDLMDEDQKPDRSDKKMALIENQAKLLKRSFDSVQIFASQYDEETCNTAHYTWGEGNFFARYGQVIQWLNNQDKDEADD
jgi:hypothetical protein